MSIEDEADVSKELELDMHPEDNTHSIDDMHPTDDAHPTDILAVKPHSQASNTSSQSSVNEVTR